MSIVGGTGAVGPGAVNGKLNGLVIPDFENPALPSEPEIPNPLLDPSQSINVSQASTDVQRVELPDFLGEEAEEATAEEPKVVAAVEDEDDIDLPNTPAAENFKKLRGVVKAERLAKRELEAKLQETAQRLESFEKGEVVPEIIRAKDERIAELEPYEKMLNLRMSPEYQDTFVRPAITLRKELERLGGDYGLPPEIMHQAVGIENRKELNQFLSRHFDDIGGLEVKRVIQELQDLGEKAIEAEKQPETALQALKSQFIEHQEKEKADRARTFEAVAKSAWNDALEKTKEEGAYQELILHPTDKEYNKNVVEPIQYKASTQYAALVKKLSQNGLKTLPPDLATGLARMVLLSIGGALTIDAKSKAEATAQEVLQHTKRTNGYIRPSIGSSNGAGHNVKAPSQNYLNPRTAGELAAKVFNK